MTTGSARGENGQEGGKPTTVKRAIDRRHWAAKIGISFRTLKDPAFKEMYPFESRLHAIDGRHYHYLDEGEGEPVVMLHGNPTWSFFYRDMILGLRDQFRCLVPDHMGCGFSEKPQKYEYYSLERHVHNLDNWLETILPPSTWNGGRINLIVHDWGGPVGFGYAMRRPQRIKRLVVMNSSIFTEGDMPPRIKMCRWPVIGEYMVRRLNLFAKKATEMTTVRPLPPLVRKFYLMPYNSWKNRVGIEAFIRDIPLEENTLTRHFLRRIGENAEATFQQTPLLVQWGMEDWCFTPFFLDLWKNAFPRAEVDEYRAGHYLLEDAGGRIIPRIRLFLERYAP